MHREQSDYQVSGSQLEPLVDELILLTNISITDPAQLALADHVYGLVAHEGSGCGVERSMILLQDVVQVWTGRWRQRRRRVRSSFTAAIAAP